MGRNLTTRGSQVSMFPLKRVPFGVPIFDPLPNVNSVATAIGLDLSTLTLWWKSRGFLH